MSEESKVRLVRCPKCENVLPELSYYSVYQCGGCGAVLRAKSRSSKVESAAVGIAEGKNGDDGVEKSEYFSEKAAVTVNKLDDGKYSPKESDGSKPAGYDINGAEAVTEAVGGESDGTMNSSLSDGVNSSRSMPGSESQLIPGDVEELSQKTRGSSSNKLSNSLKIEEDDVSLSTNLLHSCHKSAKDLFEMRSPGSNPQEDDNTNAPAANVHPNDRGGSLRTQEIQDSFNTVERATLLRKVEELKEKLTQTCDLVDRKGDEIPCGRRMAHLEPPAASYCPGFYPMNYNNTPVYEDNRSQMLKVAPNYVPCHLQNHHISQSQLTFPDQYTNSGSNPCSQYTHNATIPCSCSCFHDHHQHRFLGGVHCGGVVSDVQRNTAPLVCNPRCSNQPFYDGNSGGRLQQALFSNGKRYLRPVAGAAPFITCCHCFELLQIPSKFLSMGKKKQQRVSCGCCSKIMVLSVFNQRVVVSADAETRQNPANPREAGGGGGRGLRRGNINFCSDDSGYDFQWVDGETGQGLDSGKSQDMHSINSSSMCTSFNEDFQEDTAVVPLDVVTMADLPMGVSLSPPPPGSPVQEQLDSSQIGSAGGRFGKGNRSTRSDQEKVTTKKTSRQNSLKDVALATEVEIPVSDYPDDTMTSLDSENVAGKSEPVSFFAGIIKKGFKELSKSNQPGSHGKSCVAINGHVISDRAVRKAERMAGPIYPGKYWYDMRAGFWGVMGGPCLGIISPFIEEFSYHRMPTDCSGGNTQVFVNGRELHRKDMDLLAGRGLPTHTHMYYSVDISGKVFDLNSGEELRPLGKLAPTVEKMKRGFGMKVPMAAV